MQLHNDTAEDFIISRHVNGISINGYEHALDEDDNLMKFASREQAVEWILSNGCDKSEIGFSVFVGTEDEPDQVTYPQ